MKKILAIFLSAVIVLSFAGCGGDATTSNTKEFGKSLNGKEINLKNSVSKNLKTDKELSAYLVRAQKKDGDLYGYVDIRTGEWIIEPKYTKTDAEFGGDGWAKITNNDMENIINTSGEELFDASNIDYIREYEDDVIVATTKDNKVLLYHGAEFIKELEYDIENVVSAGATWAYTATSKDFYKPDKYIPVWIEDKNDNKYFLWYDKDGNLIHTADHAGGLAGDETGYYEFRKSKVYYSGDTWIALGDDGYFYTNGMKQVREYSIFNSTWAIGDNIIGIDGKFFDLDGNFIYRTDLRFDEPAWYSFGNGYTKVYNSSSKGEFYGYIDTAGNEVLAIDKEKFDNYSTVLYGGYIAYCENDLWGIMDINGNVITEPIFKSLWEK